MRGTWLPPPPSHPLTTSCGTTLSCKHERPHHQPTAATSPANSGHVTREGLPPTHHPTLSCKREVDASPPTHLTLSCKRGVTHSPVSHHPTLSCKREVDTSPPTHPSSRASARWPCPTHSPPHPLVQARVGCVTAHSPHPLVQTRGWPTHHHHPLTTTTSHANVSPPTDQTAIVSEQANAR